MNLTEALASVISFGIGTGAKVVARAAGRLGSSLASRLAGGRLTSLVNIGTKMKSMTGSLLERFGTSIENILEFGWKKDFEKLSKMSTKRAIGTVVMKGSKQLH